MLIFTIIYVEGESDEIIFVPLGSMISLQNYLSNSYLVLHYKKHVIQYMKLNNICPYNVGFLYQPFDTVKVK